MLRFFSRMNLPLKRLPLRNFYMEVKGHMLHLDREAAEKMKPVLTKHGLPTQTEADGSMSLAITEQIIDDSPRALTDITRHSAKYGFHEVAEAIAKLEFANPTSMYHYKL